MLKILKSAFWWLAPIAAMAAFAPWSPVLDMNIARFFFKENQFQSNFFYDFLFRYGIVFAQITAIASFLIVLASYYFSRVRRWRKASLVMLMSMVLGGGLIVHAILKDHWGRPRPRQVIEFGGKQEFRPFYSPNFFAQPEPSKSFPCGHCIMGFYFFGGWFICKREDYHKLAYFFLAFATLLGIALGIGRMAQGGHFLSDVAMTALIMWLMGGFCTHWIYKKRQP
jgi:membrane-associated PAP2 superfamily phosphatase